MALHGKDTPHDAAASRIVRDDENLAHSSAGS
jgi:hypothetical protein